MTQPISPFNRNVNIWSTVLDFLRNPRYAVIARVFDEATEQVCLNIIQQYSQTPSIHPFYPTSSSCLRDFVSLTAQNALRSAAVHKILVTPNRESPLEIAPMATAIAQEKMEKGYSKSRYF